MAINVEVTKNNNENNASILRRFRKRVQDSGVLPRVRSLRYAERVLSPYKRKMKTLESLAYKAEQAELAKLGKLPVKEERRKSTK
jgi:ribosomal protein S21